MNAHIHNQSIDYAALSVNIELSVSSTYVYATGNVDSIVQFRLYKMFQLL